MSPLWISLALTGLVLPGPQGDGKQTTTQRVPVQLQGAKKPATLDEAIATALQSHPDIRVAQAKLQMAEAELAQARLTITQKVAAGHADVAAAKADLQLAEQNYSRMVELQKRAALSAEELQQARHRLEQTRALLAAREAALHVLVGVPVVASTGQTTKPIRYNVNTLLNDYLAADAALEQQQLDAFMYWKRLNADLPLSPPQPVADKVKAALDKPVRMGKHEGVELEAYLKELLKGAELDVKVRLPATENKVLNQNITKLNLDAGEYTFRVWLQLVLDETNTYRNMGLQISPHGNAKPMRYDLYLREYGLLLSTPELAPPDAMTVQQLWKQTQTDKATKKRAEENTKK